MTSSRYIPFTSPYGYYKLMCLTKKSNITYCITRGSLHYLLRLRKQKDSNRDSRNWIEHSLEPATLIRKTYGMIFRNKHRLISDIHKRKRQNEESIVCP